jgi:AcrR family transcriptional regulator
MVLDKQKDTKKKILDSAFNVFVSNGYNDTTMSHIVKESGLSKGAIYHYYSSKKELFASLIDHWEIFSFPNFYSKNNKNESAEDTLRRFADTVYDVFCAKPDVFLAEIEFWALANKDSEIKDRSKILYDKILTLFELVLNKGVRNKEFKNIDTQIISMELLSVFQGINWFCLFGGSKDMVKKYLHQSVETILEGIRS